MNSREQAQALLDKAIERLIVNTFDHVKENAGSPIEEKFFDAFALEAMQAHQLLTASGIYYNVDPPSDMSKTDEDTIYCGVYSSYRDQCVYVYPQQSVGGHKVDFGFAFYPSKRMAFVECDGYEWHSSKEQFSKDRTFDRAIIKQFDGRAPIFRFAGSQINKDSKACAKEVLDYLVGERGGYVEEDSRSGEPK